MTGRLLIGHIGQCRFHEEELGASDLSVCSLKT
jgi:hypothetical protein